MNRSAIPAWTVNGVLPPIDSASPAGVDRSPYEVGLADIVLRFATSADRRTILTGFLDFRAALHAIGLVDGFQWVDGSFVEDVETIHDRPPRDVDVVTFFRLPAGQSQQGLAIAHPSVFEPAEAKRTFRVDAYFVQLDSDLPEVLVRQSIYWYSLWSHRRDERWKGYLQIDLSPADDAVARANVLIGDRGGATA